MATNQNPVRITVLISGNGSYYFSYLSKYISPTFGQIHAGSVLIRRVGTNLQALLHARNNALTNCSIVRVISNRIKAYGLVRARENSVPTHYQ